MSLQEIISKIQPLDEAAMEAARIRQDDLTKPRGSLGQLEDLSVQIAGITGEERPKIVHKVVTTMAGDHGVVAEGVSAYPSEVTPQMVMNFVFGGAAINVLAKHVGARVTVVDMGVASEIDHPDVLNKKVALGTDNIAKGPAMTRAQAIQALEAGAHVVKAELEKGLDILATGDMGIGNTTPSAAIAAVITGRSPADIVGRGTGVDDEGLQRKINAVKNALEVNQPDAKDGIDILAKVGGFEIGGLAGAVLAAVAHRKPVVIDGFISTAAAMIAVSLAPQARDYLISAHRSQELGHQIMLEWLGLEPLLDLQLRLGEGTGAVLAISLVEGACKILDEMATFSEAGVSDKE
ncbi:MAG: nicotinate-nucleotide--dimethylbenzimidazole phosphoribosyltransferase [Anaerolineales bacterium]|nr:nicotinate-nucleotide--dimethylbenzimidazole phosphoribosyltransferase [Chloroflexota bacterium]MBL6982917.1 nicotinate-nucleotide--dimethylbenzimidazole phosphoribosyltransferase [Anaerolineales bacterium]